MVLFLFSKTNRKTTRPVFVVRLQYPQHPRVLNQRRSKRRVFVGKSTGPGSVERERLRLWTKSYLTGRRHESYLGRWTRLGSTNLLKSSKYELYKPGFCQRLNRQFILNCLVTSDRIIFLVPKPLSLLDSNLGSGRRMFVTLKPIC